MKIDRQKVYLAMARACVDSQALPQLTGLPYGTTRGAIQGRNVRPGTLGKIARALGVDPAELIETEVKKR